MSKHLHHFLSLAAIGMLLLAGAPQPVSADGGVFAVHESDVEMPDQKAILVYDEESGHEDLILSIGLLGDSEAAWVVPVPSLPQVKAASPEWFEQLSRLTAPKIETRTVRVGECGDGLCLCTQTVVVEAGVELLSREQMGLYDVSILSADEPGALLDWLNENGYTFPEEGGPLLDSYVEEGGWYFVAARLLPGKRAALVGRDVQPLWFSFDAEQPVYPMRLTALMKDAIDVLIYVLADHRMEILGPTFETAFAGELALLPQYDEANSWELLTKRSYYVTKLYVADLYGPEVAEDLYPQRASSDEPYQQVIYDVEYIACHSITATPAPATATPPTSEFLFGPFGGRSPGSTAWSVLGVGLALLGLLVGLALIWRRRSRRKAGEKTDT